MGYSSAENTDLSTTLTRAVIAGVLTDNEAAALQRETFLRAQLVYISYYALGASLPEDDWTLADELMIWTFSLPGNGGRPANWSLRPAYKIRTNTTGPHTMD